MKIILVSFTLSIAVDIVHYTFIHFHRFLVFCKDHFSNENCSFDVLRISEKINLCQRVLEDLDKKQTIGLSPSQVSPELTTFLLTVFAGVIFCYIFAPLFSSPVRHKKKFNIKILCSITPDMILL